MSRVFWLLTLSRVYLRVALLLTVLSEQSRRGARWLLDASDRIHSRFTVRRAP